MNKTKKIDPYIEEILWGIVENFYTALLLFEKEFSNYQQQTQNLSKTKKLSLKNMINHLEIEEILTLLEYENFSNLETQLKELRQKAQPFLKDKALKNLFWRYINTIFHELAIIKEEFYRLMDAPEFSLRDTKEYHSILNEINDFLPKKLEHISELFKKAKEELKSTLFFYNHSDVLIRSIYLFGNEIIAPFYNYNLDRFLEKIYPETGPFEAYLRIAYSFHKSHFEKFAKESFQRALSITNKPPKKYLKGELKNMWEILKTTQGDGNATNSNSKTRSRKSSTTPRKKRPRTAK